jgi:hypothetical protein
VGRRRRQRRDRGGARVAGPHLVVYALAETCYRNARDVGTRRLWRRSAKESGTARRSAPRWVADGHGRPSTLDHDGVPAAAATAGRRADPAGRRLLTAKDEKTVLSVTFGELWLRWVDAFGPRFDIPDADVVQAMKGLIVGKGKTVKGIEQPGQATLVAKVKVVDGSSLGVIDYDLDAGRSHVVSKGESE